MITDLNICSKEFFMKGGYKGLSTVLTVSKNKGLILFVPAGLRVRGQVHRVKTSRWRDVDFLEMKEARDRQD